MKKNTLSKCSLAMSIAIGLGILSTSAFAVNNNVNPLTGAPEPAAAVTPVSTAAPAVNNGVQPTSGSQQNLTDNSSSGDSSATSDSKAKSDSSDDGDDYSYENEEANLKKASNLRVELTLLDLENQVKTQKDALKGIKPAQGGTQGSNGVSVDNSNGQPVAAQSQGVPTYQTVEIKTPTMKATAVYGLGRDMTAEIYIGDNKYVMSVGSVLPNGFKVVDASVYGVSLRKGHKKVTLPIVPIPQVGSNVNITTQKQLVNPATNGMNGMSPNGMPQQPQQ